MELGTRSIRSSGRGSGSIEITLPSALRAMSGLACAVSWHNAPIPHIRLAPDMRRVRSVLEGFWVGLQGALGEPPSEAPAFDIAMGAERQPGLLWEDALALARPGPTDAIILSRIVETMIGASRPQAPPGFPAMLAFLVTGAVPGPEHRQDCAIAAAVWTTRPAAPLDVSGDALWEAVRARSTPLMALCSALAADPARREQLRAAARAGARLDLRGLLP